ncbi:hypothetical protein UFOVP413_19 [uncultured Caudovirales phage]|uniref:Uncharacterized protein n=1 Tax=uncultured Caudovirales phage TaxID=2100421 RepID=A0A6J5MBG0_9CAUD|nr:hypothetical protein UFOVP413_19 [uncultured Caudovirales phage]
MTDKANNQATTDDTPDNIADDIKASIAELENPDSDESVGSGKADDADSNLASPNQIPAKETKKEDQADANKSATADTSAGDAPKHWSDADKEAFNKIPPEQRGWVLNRLKQIEADHTRKSQELSKWDKLVTPYRDYYKSLGGSPEQAFEIIAAQEYQLRTGSPEQKKAVIENLIKEYKVPMPSKAEQADGGDESEDDYNDPKISALQKQLAEVTNRLKSFDDERSQSKRKADEDDVTKFLSAKTDAGEPANPYLDEVWPEMELIVQSYWGRGEKPNLQELYDKAVWANPKTREKLLSSQREAEAKQAAANKKTKAESAKRAGASLSGAPAGGVLSDDAPDDDESIQESVRFAMRKHGLRA